MEKLTRYKFWRFYLKADMFSQFHPLFDIRIWRPFEESIFHISLSLVRCRFALGIDKNREYYQAK